MFIKRKEEYGDAFKSYLKYGYGGLDQSERRALSTDQATKGGAFISETFENVIYSAMLGTNPMRKYNIFS
jgi:HK97 family phage major capsid protein